MEYAAQKRREAWRRPRRRGAEVLFGLYADALLQRRRRAQGAVADVIRQGETEPPDYALKNSLHKDHRNTHAIVTDAVLLAEVETLKTPHAAYRGVRGVY